jgi:hypothetical protein
MAANIVCASGTAPWLDPDNVDASSPADVWFQAQVTNDGDEPGDISTLYYTATDGNGNTLVNEYFGSDTIGVGETKQIGVRIEGSRLAGAQDPVWVQLYDSGGNQLGGARLTINP